MHGDIGFYGPRDEYESIATIHRALDIGVTFLDTADMYWPYVNEELLGRAIRAPLSVAVTARVESNCDCHNRGDA